MNNDMDKYLQTKLQHLHAKHNHRKLAVSENNGVMIRYFADAHLDGKQLNISNKEYISFCSNDYLGVIAGVEALPHHQHNHKTGAGASRLISGNHTLYGKLEKTIATIKHKQSALIFGSGYLANIGVMTALMGAGDLILLDKLSHACMIDGAQLSKAKILRFAHNDMSHLNALLKKHRAQYKNCMIASETVFSMDGDLAPMVELRQICDENDAWLLVDDAHGFGLPHIQSHFADIIVGTFSKAIGTYGGYVAGSEVLRDYLVNTSRSFIFTTALPEIICAASLHNILLIQAQPWRAELILQYERQIMQKLGLSAQQSPIIPIIIGENQATIKAQQKLKDAGIMVSAIRPPTVAEGKSRLRISLNAAHTQQHIDALIIGLMNVLG